MTTTQYLRAYARFWWVVVLCTAIGVGLALWGAAASPTVYRASSGVILTPTRAITPTAAEVSAAGALAEQRVVSYAAAANGTALAEEVRNDSPSGPSARSLAKRLTVAVPSGSAVMVVSATSKTAAGAQAFALTAAQAMARLANTFESQAASGRRQLLRARSIPSSLSPATKVAGPAWRDPVVCGIAGLLVGLGLAVALARLFPRLRDPQVVSSLVGSPVVGVLRRRRRDRPSEKDADALEHVRTGVFFLRPDTERCLVVALASPRPVDTLGEDACEIAASMSSTGARVFLVRADLAATSSAADDREATAVEAGLADYLSGAVTLKDLIARDARGFHVMRAGRAVGAPDDLLHGATYAALLREASSRYDYVLVVAPPTSQGTGALAVSARAGATVLVVDERVRAKQVRESLEALQTVGVRPRGAVLVR